MSKELYYMELAEVPGVDYFTIQVVYCNFLNLYGLYVLRFKSFLTIFSS